MSMDELKEIFDDTVNEHINCPLFSQNQKDDNLLNDIKNNKIVIYTAFTGDYDTLKDPKFIDDNCDYVCFTDNPNVKSDIWKIIPMDESNLDDNRKAKQYRVFPHKYFLDYKYSFWIDASFEIIGSIREYIYTYIKSNMLCVIHNERDCVYDEAIISFEYFSRYSKPLLQEQINNYKDMGFPSHYGLISSGFLFRKHDSEVKQLMDDWWNEIIDYSNQDQVSFSYVCWKNNFHPSVAPIFTWKNQFWTKYEGYQHKKEVTTPLVSENLRKNIENNVADINNLKKEDYSLLLKDINTLEYELDSISNPLLFSKLFIDCGYGFNEDEVINITFNNNEVNKLYFDLSSFNNIKQFSFAPTLDKLCSCSILSLKTDGKDAKIIGANSYNPLTDSKHLFYNKNPLYTIVGDFENSSFIEIEFKLEVYNDFEFNQEFKILELKNIIHNQNKEINKLFGFWNETKNNLNHHGNIINQLHRNIYELNIILSSKGIGFVRKIHKLKGKILSHPFIGMLLKSNLHFNQFINNRRAYKKIKELNLFDAEFYTCNYPHVLEGDSHVDPLIHYLYTGYKQGTNPSNEFDNNFYLTKYPNVNMNPLVHYVLYGFNEGKLINHFDKGFINNSSEDIYIQFEKGISNHLANEILKNDLVWDINVIIPYIESKEPVPNLDNKLRVGVFLDASFIENMEACPYIRLFKPLKSLSDNNKDYKFFFYTHKSIAQMNPDNVINYKCFDVVIIQRIFQYADLFIEKCKEHDIKIIFEMDDDLIDIDINNIGYNHIIQFKPSLLNVVNNADLITFSTPALVKRFSKYNDNIHLIRNYLLEDLLPMVNVEKNNSNKVVIGYFGTLTHTEDLLMIKNIIIGLKFKLKVEHNIDLVFEVLGGFSDNDDDSWYDTIDFCQLSLPDFYEYLEKVANWDIGIAPLENNYFNQCKSELKYIEYTALGVPVVFSDFGPYNEAITDGNTGFLAKNPFEWSKKLEKLVLDSDLRQTILNNARNDLKENYTLEDRVEKWDNILSSFMDKLE